MVRKCLMSDCYFPLCMYMYRYCTCIHVHLMFWCESVPLRHSHNTRSNLQCSQRLGWCGCVWTCTCTCSEWRHVHVQSGGMYMFRVEACTDCTCTSSYLSLMRMSCLFTFCSPPTHGCMASTFRSVCSLWHFRWQPEIPVTHQTNTLEKPVRKT